jgi:hypothetical protein
MSSVTLEEAQSTRDRDENNKSRHSVAVKVSTSRTSNLVLTTTERFEANTSQSNGNSRVSSRRFSRTHVVRVGDLHASNFSGMDSSSVISTWGLSRPGVDLLATYLDKHRVSSVDLFNTIPTHSDFSRGIGNRDSFIEVSHLGANKAQMKEEGDHKSPARSGQDSSEVFAKETLANDAKTDEVDGTSEEVTTSRTVHLSITHVSSLSRKVMR